jgi:hypothetical protein
VTLLATVTPAPKTPAPTRPVYVWPTKTPEASFGGAAIGDRP